VPIAKDPARKFFTRSRTAISSKACSSVPISETISSSAIICLSTSSAASLVPPFLLINSSVKEFLIRSFLS
jgi:hypothetical protein